jgi:hypothetical protein
MTNAYIDRQRGKTIDGVTFTNTHSGQKLAYGDSFYEYDVESALPPEEVEKVCATRIYAAIPIAQWRIDNKGGSAGAYFRAHYTFTKKADGKYSYVVCFPYAD